MQVKELLLPFGSLKAFNLVMDKNTGNSKVRISAPCTASASFTASGLHNKLDWRLRLSDQYLAGDFLSLDCLSRMYLGATALALMGSHAWLLLFCRVAFRQHGLGMAQLPYPLTYSVAAQ